MLRKNLWEVDARDSQYHPAPSPTPTHNLKMSQFNFTQAYLWFPRGRRVGEGGLGVWGEQMETIIQRVDNKILLQSTGNGIS